MSGVVLEGRVARLRGASPADAERAFEVLHGNRAILEWLEWPGPANVEEMAARFSAWRVRREDGDDYAFVVEELAGSAAGPHAPGAFAGALTLRFAGHPGVGVVGYWIDPARWGRGLATEAVRLASWLAFERLGARALTARVHHGNERSRHVLERCGWSEVSLTRVPDQPGCGARPQWGFRLERALARCEPRFEPERALVDLREDPDPAQPTPRPALPAR